MKGTTLTILITCMLIAASCTNPLFFESSELSTEAEPELNAPVSRSGNSTVDFEDQAAGTNVASPYDSTEGLRFRAYSANGNEENFYVLSTSDGFDSNGFRIANWGGSMVISKTDGSVFDLVSFDYASGPYGNHMDATVSASGYTSQTIESSVQTSSTITLNWTGVSSVTIDWDGGLDQRFGFIDNVVLSSGENQPPQLAGVSDVGAGINGINYYSPHSVFVDVVKHMRWFDAGSFDSNGYPVSVASLPTDFEDQTAGVNVASPYDSSEGLRFRAYGGTGLEDNFYVYGTSDGFDSNGLRIANWGGSMVISKTDGSTFDLVSFDYASAPWGNHMDATVSATGYTAQTIESSVQTSSTITLNWTSVSSVTIDWDGGLDQRFGFVDNFVVGTASIVRGRAAVGAGASMPDGDYVVTWEGSGEVVLDYATKTSEDLSGSVKRRVYNRNNDNSIDITITLPATNIHVYLPGLENHTSMWNPDYIEYLTPFSGSYLRFMDPGETNNSEQVNWSDRTPRNWASYYDNHRSWDIPGYTARGAASYEAMIELANELDADLWVCIPHQATDTYVQNMATLIKTGYDGAVQTTSPLESGLKVFIEYSNEIWNWSFAQSTWVNNNVTAINDPNNNFFSKCARISVDKINVFANAFNDSSRVIRVLGTQTGYGAAWNTAKMFDEIDEANDIDTLALTTYFKHDMHQWIYDNWTTIKTNYTPYFDEFTSRIGSGAFQEVDTYDYNETVWAHFNECAAHNVPVLTYEGNSHMDPVGTVSDVDGDGNKDPLNEAINYTYGDDLVAWMHGAEREQGFADIYETWLERYEASGLSSNTIFTTIAKWSKYGQWGHVEYVGQSVSAAKKYKMILDHYGLTYPNP